MFRLQWLGGGSIDGVEYDSIDKARLSAKAAVRDAGIARRSGEIIVQKKVSLYGGFTTWVPTEVIST